MKNQNRRTLARRLGLALATMLLPLVAVAGVSFFTFATSTRALEDFRDEAVAESHQIDHLKGLLESADDVGETYVESGKPFMGRRFQRLSRHIARDFEGLAALDTQREAKVSDQARALWTEASSHLTKAAALSKTQQGDLLDPFHDTLDEAVGLLGDANSLNVQEIAGEITSLGRLEHFQLFAALGILALSSLIAAILATRVRRSITMPLLMLEEAAGRFGSDDLSHRIDVTGDDELAQLGIALNTMAIKLEESRKDLTESQQQRRELLGKLLEASEQERKLLASELHDGPIQGLTQLMYELELSCIDTEGSDGHGLADDLSKVQEGLGGQIETLRQMMVDLRPPVLDELGLEGAIRSHLDAWAGKLPSTAISLELPGRLDPTIESMLFRVVQEALVNVAKHAFANNVSVYMAEEDSVLTLTIRDDGVGFSSAQTATGHIGIDAMRERVESMGGTLSVDSTQGSGTTVSVRFETKEVMPV